VVQHATPDLAWVLAIGPRINYQYSNSELDTESNKKVIIGAVTADRYLLATKL
jgi:hypothetical protein